MDTKYIVIYASIGMYTLNQNYLSSFSKFIISVISLSTFNLGISRKDTFEFRPQLNRIFLKIYILLFLIFFD